MGDSSFPMSNSDSLHGGTGELIRDDFSDNMFSWWDTFSDFIQAPWGFADLGLPSLDLNMFPAEPLPHSFFDLEDFLGDEVIDPGQMSADVNPPLLDVNIFFANAPSDEPFDILNVFNFSPPPPPPPPGGNGTVGNGGSEADGDQSTSPEARSEETAQEDSETQDIEKDVQDLRKRKRDGTPGESDESDRDTVCCLTTLSTEN
jgi:hypothetical protein